MEVTPHRGLFGWLCDVLGRDGLGATKAALTLGTVPASIMSSVAIVRTIDADTYTAPPTQDPVTASVEIPAPSRNAVVSTTKPVGSRSADSLRTIVCRLVEDPSARICVAKIRGVARHGTRSVIVSGDGTISDGVTSERPRVLQEALVHARAEPSHAATASNAFLTSLARFLSTRWPSVTSLDPIVASAPDFVFCAAYEAPIKERNTRHPLDFAPPSMFHDVPTLRQAIQTLQGRMAPGLRRPWLSRIFASDPTHRLHENRELAQLARSYPVLLPFLSLGVLAEVDPKAARVASALSALDIEFLERFEDFETLEAIVANRLAPADAKVKDPRRVAVAIFPKSDWNDSFTYNDLTALHQTYRTMYFEAENDADFPRFLARGTDDGLHPASLIVVAGHGWRHGLQLGPGFWDKSMLDTRDEPTLAKERPARFVKPDAIVVLDSCNNAITEAQRVPSFLFGKWGTSNQAEMVSRLFPSAKVFALKKSVNPTMVFDDDGFLRLEPKEDVVCYRNGHVQATLEEEPSTD